MSRANEALAHLEAGKARYRVIVWRFGTILRSLRSSSGKCTEHLTGSGSA